MTSFPMTCHTLAARYIGPTAFSLVVLFMLSTGALSLAGAVGWVGKPFAGFFYHQSRDVGSSGDPDWAGIQAGVRYRDVILEVNGRKVNSGVEVQEIVSQTPTGESLHYLLSRRGETFELDIPVSVFTWRDFLSVFGMLFPFGLALWSIGVIVYALKRDTYVSWVFLLFCLSVGTYAASAIDIFSTHGFSWSYHVNMWALAFFPAFSVHLSLLFPERTAFIEKWPRSPVFLYGVSFVLSFLHSYYFHALSSERPTIDEIQSISSSMLSAINCNRLYALLGFIALIAAGLHAYWRSSSVIARQRARIIVLSAGVAFIPPTVIMAGVSLGQSKIPFNWFTPIIIVFPAAVGYAIARHNLFDVDVYIKRAVGYAIMTAVVGLAYFSVQTIFSTFVLKPVFGAQAEQVYPVIFALLVVFFFNPVSRRVQEGVDRLFYRKSYDYKATVAAITDALNTIPDLTIFISKVIQTIREQMFIDRAGVILLDARKRGCESVFDADGGHEVQGGLMEPCLSHDDPLLSLLAEKKTLITKYDIAEDPGYADVREMCGQRFSDLGASLALPLFHGEEFTGVLALGYKKSGHFYAREDVDLVKTLSSMISAAIEQAREKGQRASLMQLFSKHVSPQVAESLWEQRDQFLDGGRPRSQKLVATVMFTDLQGFTGISEKMDPEVLMEFLNTYMEAITRTVMEHRGVVDDYFGDGVKVNFGVPIPRCSDEEIRDDAMNAVNCALALAEEVARLNSQVRTRGLPALRMRVGILTGPVVAGSLGSAERMKYTTLGDTVNTASRLESFEKHADMPRVGDGSCRILIGESTLKYLEDSFDARLVGEVELQGKESRIKAYSVTGKRNKEAKAQDGVDGGSQRSGVSWPAAENRSAL